MSRIQGDLKERTFEFAVAILSLADQFPNVAKGWVIGKQVIRCATSIGANVREADNALTDAEFAQKCSIARKEAGETHYWLQLCQRTGLLEGADPSGTAREADELARILSSIVKGTQRHMSSDK
jgi:four helix bundle protein